MKKIIRRILFAMMPLLLCSLLVLPTYAMSDEEKELFDMLGVEYTVDENGNFKEFVVSENTQRMTYEKRLEIAKKYFGKKSVGNYKILSVIDTTYNGANFYVYAENDTPLFMSNGASDIYVDSAGNFFSLNFSSSAASEPSSLTKGVVKEGDVYWPSDYETYERKNDGEFIITEKIEGDIQYFYDRKGNLTGSIDYTTRNRYDADGNLSEKQVLGPGDGGAALSVPHEVADEVQALIDKNGGSMYQKNSDGSKQVLDEVRELIIDAYMARQLELDLEVYQERNEIYKQMKEETGCISVESKAKIFGVDRSKFWSNVEAVEESDYPAGISEDGIADILVDLINDYRIENGLSPVDNSDPLLQQVADIRAEEATYVMDCAHSRPHTGTSASFGVAENLAMIGYLHDWTNEDIAKALFEGWKNSPGHNANMLREDHTQGCMGVKIVWSGNSIAVYASNDFFGGDYQNDVDDRIKNMIDVGPQGPGNMDSTQDYYRKIFGMKANVATYESGANQEQYVLNVLNPDGTKFTLPNGKEWTEAWAQLKPVNGLYDETGVTQTAQTGEIYFSCEDGQVYCVYIYDEMVTDEETLETIYFTNNYSGNTIVLQESPYRTVDDVFPGGYDLKTASRACYYILNGEMIILD